MAFADPQSITINAVPYSLPRISAVDMKSLYATADDTLQMTISHQESKGRTRRMVRIDKRVIATDPLMATSSYQNLGVYIVIDQPDFGYSITDIDNIVQGFKTWLSTSNVTKVCGAES